MIRIAELNDLLRETFLTGRVARFFVHLSGFSCYINDMKSTDKAARLAEKLADRARQQDIAQLQAIEDNPFDAEDEAMFAMFEREDWSHERCLAYIREQALKALKPQAAE